MKFEGNPYYDPGKCGLEKVAELDFSDGCYQFDITAVWTKAGEKKFYWKDDSGCSCPSPFEDVSEEAELESGGFKQVRDHLTSRFDGEGWGTYVKITELHPVLEKLHAISKDWED